MSYDMQDLTPDSKRGWEVSVNGEPITPERVEFRNTNIGWRAVYGLRPEGYDGLVIEQDRGGAVIAPYMIDHAGNLYIGQVLEERKTMGGYVWNVPRGMVDDTDEGHAAAARREFGEETGHRDPVEIGRRMAKLATGVNANSAIFNTVPATEGQDRGVSFYAVPFEEAELVKTDGTGQSPEYVFPGQLTPDDQSEHGERVAGLRFRRAQEVLASPQDMFSAAAAGLILAHTNELRELRRALLMREQSTSNISANTTTLRMGDFSTPPK